MQGHIPAEDCFVKKDGFESRADRISERKPRELRTSTFMLYIVNESSLDIRLGFLPDMLATIAKCPGKSTCDHVKGDTHHFLLPSVARPIERTWHCKHKVDQNLQSWLIFLTLVTHLVGNSGSHLRRNYRHAMLEGAR